MRRLHEAKVNNTPEVVIWGTGVSRREFMHVDDLADCVVWLLENYEDKQFLNVGTGEDISIKETAELLQKLVGYQGKLVFDATKPDGMPKKLLDVSKLHAAGWKHKISFEEGLKRTYEWYLANIAE
jgi:GDP-L-fucose synthase